MGYEVILRQQLYVRYDVVGYGNEGAGDMQSVGMRTQAGTYL